MNIDNEKQLWQQAWQRFQVLDWQESASKQQIEQLHAMLPKRLNDEDIPIWLKRVLTSENVRFMPFTQIIRRAAHSGLEDYPLPEKPLLSADESFRFFIYAEQAAIHIKVEALSTAIDKYANCTLGLASKEQPQQIVLMIKLDSEGEGETCAKDTIELRKTLFNPLIGLLE